MFDAPDPEAKSPPQLECSPDINPVDTPSPENPEVMVSSDDKAVTRFSTEPMKLDDLDTINVSASVQIDSASGIQLIVDPDETEQDR